MKVPLIYLFLIKLKLKSSIGECFSFSHSQVKSHNMTGGGSVLCRGDGKDFCLFSFIFVSSFGYFQTWNWNSGQFDRCWLTVFHVTSSILVAFLKPEIQIGLKSVFACVLTFHLSAKSSNASLSQLHNENKTTPTSLWDNITDRLLYSCNVVVINYSPIRC